MSRYKLVREYPGSPPINSEVIRLKEGYILSTETHNPTAELYPPEFIEKFTEFWQVVN